MSIALSTIIVPMTLHATDRDPGADPGVGFYRYANGGWIDANPIPAGYGSWGSFEEVSRRNEVVLRELLERANPFPAPPGGGTHSFQVPIVFSLR